MNPLAIKLRRLMLSTDIANLELALQMLQSNEDTQGVQMPQPYEVANELLYLHFFHLPALTELTQTKFWELRSQVQEIFEEVTGHTPAGLESFDGDFATFIGPWEHYGGNDFCRDINFEAYLNDLAKNIQEVPHVDIINLTEIMMESPIEYEYIGKIPVREVGRMYFCNYATQEKVLALLKKENEPNNLLHRDTYLLQLPNEWAKLGLHKIDLTDTTFETYPNNFDCFPTLNTLILHGTRTSKDYESDEYRNPEDAFVRLQEWPASLTALTKLAYLDLGRTLLGTPEEPAEIPHWLPKLQSLQTLYLPFAHLKQLPLILQKLPALKKLYIPQIYLSESDKTVWGIRHYQANKFIELDQEWFQGCLPACVIEVYKETIEEENTEWESGVEA
ncbi:hypothetical protein BKI52_18000 [marine bacterium AO1-C]|nr:hypothetical protein BKI52_18000 [marine bacterium AO1-C]